MELKQLRMNVFPCKTRFCTKNVPAPTPLAKKHYKHFNND